MAGNFWISTGAVFAALGVAAGAVGTHFLKESLKWPDADLQTYDVAVRYQLVHALGLILVGVLIDRGDRRWLQAAAIALAAGLVLFSGGLYGWLFTGFKPLVHVVPLGGLAWILGWLFLAVGALAARR